VCSSLTVLSVRNKTTLLHMSASHILTFWTLCGVWSEFLIKATDKVWLYQEIGLTFYLEPVIDFSILACEISHKIRKFLSHKLYNTLRWTDPPTKESYQMSLDREVH
jgi:hypothetical protein